jgi:uncharacterized SAM-binding protein YcdF (DUF218 family)
VTWNYLLSDLVLPPTSLAAAALVGLALLRRHRTLGLALAAGAMLALLALSLPVVAMALARTLEPPPISNADLARAQAIVILAGGNNRGAPEWGGETVKTYSLQRVRYGARLARASGLPILVTGGTPQGGRNAEAALMRDVLVDEYGLEVRWVETASRTTAENAVYSASVLQAAGLSRVALVTDAIHMPRSRRAFERAGLEVIAAPTAFAGQRPFKPEQLVPGVAALHLSNMALREWFSRALYALRDD